MDKAIRVTTSEGLKPSGSGTVPWEAEDRPHHLLLATLLPLGLLLRLPPSSILGPGTGQCSRGCPFLGPWGSNRDTKGWVLSTSLACYTALQAPGWGTISGDTRSWSFSPLWLTVLPLALPPRSRAVSGGTGPPGSWVRASNCVRFISPPPCLPSTSTPLSICMLPPVSPTHASPPPGMAHLPPLPPHGLHLPGTAWLAAWHTAAPGSLRHAGSRGVQSLPHQLGL